MKYRSYLFIFLIEDFMKPICNFKVNARQNNKKKIFILIEVLEDY